MIERAKTNNYPWEYCGIIAAAYAEFGNFEAAVDWQKKSIQKSPEEWAPYQKERLQKYLNRIPFRDQNPPVVVRQRHRSEVSD